MSEATGYHSVNPTGGIRGFARLARRWWKPVLGTLGVSLAAYLLYRTLGRYSFVEIRDQLLAVPAHNVALAFAFAAASYLTLTLFDYFALRYAGHRLPYRRAALASFTALSLGHNIGFAALSSGAVRYRFYARWGLSAEEVAKVILFCGFTVGVGLAVLAVAALLLRPELAARMVGFGEGAVMALAAVIAAILASYVALAVRVRRPLHIRGWKFEMPPLRLVIAQFMVGPLNFAFVAACLHQTLATARASYFEVACAYVLANVAALLAHVPGGLGVIEAVVTMLIPGTELIGGLLLFRAIYFLVPLALGLLCFAGSEVAIRGRKAS